MKFVTKKANKMLGISLAVAGLFAMGSNAQAASLITGGISFGGTDKVEDAGGTALTNNLSTGTQVIFNGSAFNGHTTTPLSQYVADGTQWGSFSTVADHAAVTFASPFVFAPVAPPVNNLWSVGGFSFSLTNWTDAITAASITITGSGVLSGAGYTDTLGLFSLVLNNSTNGTANKLTLTAANSAVPVPAALLFVAPALAGVFGFSRRKNASLSA